MTLTDDWDNASDDPPGSSTLSTTSTKRKATSQTGKENTGNRGDSTHEHNTRLSSKTTSRPRSAGGPESMAQSTKKSPKGKPKSPKGNPKPPKGAKKSPMGTPKSPKGTPSAKPKAKKPPPSAARSAKNLSRAQAEQETEDPNQQRVQSKRRVSFTSPHGDLQLDYEESDPHGSDLATSEDSVSSHHGSEESLDDVPGDSVEGSPQGSLLDHFPPHDGDDHGIAAEFILKWTQALAAGATALERALGRERTREHRPPVTFALIANAGTRIKVAHGIEVIALEDERHPEEGKIGFFVGDRISVHVNGVIHQRDPPFCITQDFHELVQQFNGLTASPTRCSKADHQLLPAQQKGSPVFVPHVFPLPRAWWDFFLNGNRTPGEAYRWITYATKSWTSSAGQTAANLARQWAQAACTQTSPEIHASCVAIRVRTPSMDEEIISWAIRRLATYLPALPQAAPPPIPREAPPDTRTELCHQTALLAQHVLQSVTERNDRERTAPTKQVPETLLCNLLGLSGLTWDERNLLAPIWQQLYQQPDKAAKEVVIRTFFQGLGAQCPAFRHFRNSLLFEHITSHKFEPGAAYETCHHGISLLAVSLRSFADQERERHDDECFEQATNRTPDAVRKHTTKTPPPLPTSIGELLQLLERLIVLTVGLFTVHCSLAIQLRALQAALQEKEHRLMGSPETTADLIPQLVWAIISTAREFYGHISTRADIDPADDEAPRVAIAQLSIYTTMMKAGLKLDLAGIPDQWRRKASGNMVTPVATNTDSTGNTRKKDKDDKGKRHGSDPFVGQSGAKPTMVHPKPPRVFAEFEPLCRLKSAGGVSLREIASEAGIQGGLQRVDVTGLPANACLSWLCLGKCSWPRCTREHPPEVSDTAMENLFKQLEPGIIRVADKKKTKTTQ